MSLRLALIYILCSYAVRYGPGDTFELVAIEERPVIARYYGLGQINASTQL